MRGPLCHGGHANRSAIQISIVLQHKHDIGCGRRSPIFHNKIQQLPSTILDRVDERNKKVLRKREEKVSEM
jgi:hypothetical protein